MARTEAVVDVGSNTVRLLVAHVGSTGVVETHTDGIPLRIGEELEAAGRISDEKVAAAADAVGDLCAQARVRGASSLQVLVTAPGRQADNAEELVGALERAAGLCVRVLSPDDEARLSFAGAVAAAAPSARVVAVVDLGGASTEIAVGRPESGPVWLRSIDLGALRLTQRFEDLDSARAAVREAFAGLAPPLPGGALVVGGSARALRRVVGPTLGPDELARAQAALAGRTAAEIADEYGVKRERAGLLLAAAVILAEVQRRLIVPLEVAEAGLREGALLAVRDVAAA